MFSFFYNSIILYICNIFSILSFFLFLFLYIYLQIELKDGKARTFISVFNKLEYIAILNFFISFLIMLEGLEPSTYTLWECYSNLLNYSIFIPNRTRTCITCMKSMFPNLLEDWDFIIYKLFCLYIFTFIIYPRNKFINFTAIVPLTL